jgi:acyl-CoA thioesterase I
MAAFNRVWQIRPWEEEDDPMHFNHWGFRIRSAGVAVLIGLIAAFLATAPADAASGTVVALGASNTYGKGVARGQAYPAQLEALLRANGHNVRVINAGINGDTTAGMLSRLNRLISASTKVVILQPGGNDRRKGTGEERGANISEIQQQLSARGIKVILLENASFRGLPHQPDRMHLTPEGYHAIAEQLLPQVTSALGQ